MLPALDPKALIESNYQDFLTHLGKLNFSGDIEYSCASRLAVSTDNSIYQQLPQAEVFLKNIEDLSLIGKITNAYEDVKFSVRGGVTWTNGQSLTSGIIVDVSRHINQVLKINTKQNWAKEQAGVVKDQFNDTLKPLGLFFAPDLSTSSRATIGGTISTDTSGQGSLVHGKTSDHILGLTSVMADGIILDTTPKTIDDAKTLSREHTFLAKTTQQLLDTCLGKRQQILDKFPRLNRFLTGYDLENTLNKDLSILDISRVVTGSEGSLVFVAEAKVNISPIANFKALVNVKYNSFESALRHAPSIVAANATSLETVDSNVLNLAKQDIIRHSVESLITEVEGKDVLGLNMVEYNSNDQADIEQKIASLSASLNTTENLGVIGYQITYDKADIQKIYAMRKK